MSKNKTVLPIKGMRTPRFLIWLRGFWHGKVMHTGGINPETNVIASGYVTGQIKQFRNACIIRRAKAEDKLTKVWSDADELLIDYAAITSTINDSTKLQSTHNESTAQIRSKERAANRRVTRKAERQTILKNMAKIANDIRAEYNNAHDQMEATSELLASVLSCYGHGLLMQPVYNYNLPDISYEDCVKSILDNHKDTWNAINSILKKEVTSEDL